jgi:hypothetical protein
VRGAKIALLLAGVLALSAPVAAKECGTDLTPETLAALEAQERAGAYVLKRSKEGLGTQYVLTIPCAIHVVRRNDGSGGLPDTSVENTMNNVNNYFRPAGIEFVRSGLIRYIDNTDFYSNIDTQMEIDQLRGTDVVANQCNIYFTDYLNNGEEDLCGKGSFTADAVQGVVMDNDCTTFLGNLSTMTHELGHYLDLLHTHETASGVECPDGSNCATTGDKLCDTPADPELSAANVDDSCAYTGDATACGLSYDPDPRNIMSYADPKNCRDTFSPQQRDKVLATLINLRSNLIQSELNVTWLDFNYGGLYLGTYHAPFRTLANAVASTANGGTIVIKSSSSAETMPVTTKQLFFDSFRGPATAGAP